MPKTLVIVESPTKARTISRFVGDDFIVESSIGHIRDLPNDALSVRIEAKACIDGVVRREAGLPMTLANPLILNFSINPESGS